MGLCANVCILWSSYNFTDFPLYKINSTSERPMMEANLFVTRSSEVSYAVSYTNAVIFVS